MLLPSKQNEKRCKGKVLRPFRLDFLRCRGLVAGSCFCNLPPVPIIFGIGADIIRDAGIKPQVESVFVGNVGVEARAVFDK